MKQINFARNGGVARIAMFTVVTIALTGAVTLINPTMVSASDILAAGDVKKGEKVFKKCRACHSVKEGGKHKAGPNLWNIINSPVANADGFRKYSKAMKKAGGTWTIQRLDAFLKKPKAEIPKTRMTFVGLKKESQRANLLAYLNQMSDDPIKVAVRADSASSSSGEEEKEDYGKLFVAEGVAETFAYCTPCHSERIVAQQGLTRKGWEELFEWMVDEQEMDEIEEPDRTKVLDYLAKHYNEDRPNFPK